MLSFLTNLRDMKSSLASGMMLLFCIWLIFANAVANVDQGDSLTGNIRRLADYIGTAGSLGVIAFVAYILGLVLSLDRVVMYLLLERKWQPGQPVLLISRTTYQRLSKKLTTEIQGAIAKAPSDFVVKTTLPDEVSTDKLSAIIDDRRTEAYLHNRIVTSLIDDLDILAVQLHSKHDKAYDQYDKAKSEAAFRASLVLPTVALAVVLVCRLLSEQQVILAFILGSGVVLASFLLLRGAGKKQTEANEEIYNAFVVGHIDYAPVSTLSEISKGNLKPERTPNSSIASPARIRIKGT